MKQPINEQVKSKRDSFIERLKGKYPDKQFADDEEIYGTINDDYDDYDNRIKHYEKDNKEFSDMMGLDPRMGQLMAGLMKGGDLVTGFVSLFGPEIADAYDDPEMMEKLAKANKEYLERVSKNKELEDEYTKNLEDSLQAIEKIKEERGYTDEQVDEGLEKLCQIGYDVIVGKFTPEALDFAFKGISHDADVEDAAHEAEVRGRNANIEEHLKKRTKGDGIPVAPGGRAGAVPTAPRRSLGALDRASDTSSIWDRGGFTRNKTNQ